MRHELATKRWTAKSLQNFLGETILTISALALLISCSGTDSQVIHLTGQNGTAGNPTDVNKAQQDAAQPLDQKGLKLHLMQELMRFHASAKYLIAPPASTAAAFSKGCISYQPSNLEDRNLRATYNCAWLQPTRDGQRQLQWILTSNEDFSPAAAADPSKTVEAKATLTVSVQTPKTHKLLRTEAYVRDTKITPKDATTFTIKAQSGLSSVQSQTSRQFEGEQLIASTSENEALEQISAPAAIAPLPPHHPVPRPTPTSKATDSWAATIDGFWQKGNANLDLEKGSELVITYRVSASDDPVVLTMYSTSNLTFNEADGACPLPSGTLSWSSQKGSAAAVTGTMKLDATGITDQSGGGDTIAWPADSCLEFTAPAAQ